MKKEFVIRGQTASGGTETINFGIKNGYAHRLVEFQLYPSTSIGNSNAELLGSVTAGKTAVAPTDPNFNNEGLIATAMMSVFDGNPRYVADVTVVNDTFLITQNLILMVQEVTAGTPVNWQCRFEPVKMSQSDISNQNYRQFMIFDE